MSTLLDLCGKSWLHHLIYVVFSSQARRRERHVFLACFIWPVRLIVVGAFTYLVLSRGVSVSLDLASCGIPLNFALLGTGGS